MKNTKFEHYGRMQRQYHRHNPWDLSQGGLYIPHSYSETKPDSLSWWDDVGFILNERRVIVWWRHPRHVYADAIEKQSCKEVGDDPGDDWLFEGCTTNYKKVGNSRKKIVSYTSRQPSEDQEKYYNKLHDTREHLRADGIEFDVTPSWKRERLSWATGISLVAPMEVRNQTELALAAKLARRLILGQTTLESEFPSYRYNKAQWLQEQKLREVTK